MQKKSLKGGSGGLNLKGWGVVRYPPPHPPSALFGPSHQGITENIRESKKTQKKSAKKTQVPYKIGRGTPPEVGGRWSITQILLHF